jgi:formate dehydrogenase gamma subunit
MADRTRERYLRFTVSDRIEHWVQVIAFTALAITGLVQRYAGAWLSQRIIEWLGGIESVRIIHRAFATALMLAVVYHFGAVAYRKYVLRQPRSMVPTFADLKNIGASVSYAIGLRKEPPRQGRFTWQEMAEYWALVWGTVVMVLTGFLLWNPIATASILPGQFIPAALAAHSGEALLAVLAILVWHIYHVHIKHTNKSIFSGYMSREEMEEYHPLELEQINSGVPQRDADAAAVARRTRIFYPAFGVTAVVLLVGIYFFVTFEDTALDLETITPPEQVAIFAPVETTAPSATTEATTTTEATDTTVAAGPATWEGAIQEVLGARCGACHGDAAAGGLDVTTYEGLLAGGASGAALVPGDPEAGSIVAILGAGGHPGSLSDDELTALQDWIAEGAPETDADVGAPVTTTTTVPEALSWADTFAPIVAGKCQVCHDAFPNTTRGGLDLSTYEAAVAGGESGPGIVPGDPDASLIVQVMETGTHPLQFTPAELDRLRAWIEAGAPAE